MSVFKRCCFYAKARKEFLGYDAFFEQTFVIEKPIGKIFRVFHFPSGPRDMNFNRMHAIICTYNPDAVVYIADAYTKHEKAEDTEKLREFVPPGTFEKEFNQGVPTVSEGVMIQRIEKAEPHMCDGESFNYEKTFNGILWTDQGISKHHPLIQDEGRSTVLNVVKAAYDEGPISNRVPPEYQDLFREGMEKAPDVFYKANDNLMRSKWGCRVSNRLDYLGQS